MKQLSEIKIGDKVDKLLQPGYTAGGDDSYGLTVTDITTQYDEKTGKAYKVIWVDKHGFEVDYEINKAFPVNSPWAYYLVPSEN